MSAPLDPDILRAQTGGDAALERDVLRLFVAQAQATIVMVQETAEPSLLVAGLHRLQGSARAVGAHRLDAAARSLEGLLRAGGPVDRDMVASLGSAAAEACRYAASLLAASDATASPNGMKAGKHLRPSVSHSDQRGFREGDS